MTGGDAVLVNLAGGVALLLWGARMVRTGVVRAWGDRLRVYLKSHVNSAGHAVTAGFGATLLLQSSTATALILAGLAGSGFIAPSAGLAALLGADLGSAMVAAVFALTGAHAAVAPPLLILAGYLAFSLSTRFRPKNFGRILMGLGLMFLALQMIVGATEPLRDAPLFRTVIAAIGDDPVLALAIGAAAAWASHSSIAVLLVVASLAAKGVIGSEPALLLVLGVNLGAGMPAVIGTLAQSPAARRLPLTNLACRASLAVMAAPFAGEMASLLPALALPGPASMVAAAHVAFNLLLVAALVPLARPLMELAARVLPDEAQPFDPLAAQRFLQPSALETPAVALSGVAMEVARMTEVLDRMLMVAHDSLMSHQSEPLKALPDLDRRLTLYRTGIQGYLAELRNRPLSPGEETQVTEALMFVSNLEHAGGIIARPLRDRIRAKIKEAVRFSDARRQTLEAMFAHVRSTLTQAAAVFASRDVDGACLLINQKTAFREMEDGVIRRELGNAGKRSAEHSGGLFLDIVRELHKVNSQAISLAYPIAETAGILRLNRLKEGVGGGS
jgi:phosphate:Na+ symporter